MLQDVQGKQLPRVASVPDYVASSGDEAIELASLAGLDLYPWQQSVLRDALGERDDGKWAAPTVGLVCPRQNGKNAILEARELAGLFLLGEQVIVHSAHEQATASEQFRRVLGLIEGTPQLARRMKRPIRGKGSEAIELRTGQVIYFKTRTGGGTRGFSIDCIIFDEAYELPETAISAMVPTLSARPNTQTWYTSSAVDQQKHQYGTALTRQRQRGIAGKPNIAYFEWSLEGDDPAKVPAHVAASQDAWAESNPSFGLRLSPESVGREHDGEMGPREFAVERLGIGDWPALDGADRVIPLDRWRVLADGMSKPEGRVCFAFDVTPDRSSACIAVAGLRHDGMPHIELVDQRPGTFWLSERLAELLHKHRNRGVWCDPAGPAGSLLPDLKALRVEPEVVGTREHGQACGLFYDAVMGGNLRHLDQVEVLDAVAGAAKRSVGDAWLWDRKGSEVNISPLVACTLALWGAQQTKKRAGGARAINVAEVLAKAATAQ